MLFASALKMPCKKRDSYKFNSNCRGAENRTRSISLRASEVFRHFRLKRYCYFDSICFKIWATSGCRESNSVYLLPKQTYYRYTTPRRCPYFKLSKQQYIFNPKAEVLPVYYTPETLFNSKADVPPVYYAPKFFSCST